MAEDVIRIGFLVKDVRQPCCLERNRGAGERLPGAYEANGGSLQ
ncbi:MAG TPA: hypothetical protein VK436_03895 [Methanocella sp.]|nr:hypothetical protein [Methanocella sp.]